jgi:hypothetical protein
MSRAGRRGGKLPVPDAKDPNARNATDMSRQRLALRLMHLAEQVAESYCVFAVGMVPDEPKSFAAHHAACKAALAHLDLLLKLSRAIAPDAATDLQPTLLIADARRALVNATPDLELTAEQVDAIDLISHVTEDDGEELDLGDED